MATRRGFLKTLGALGASALSRPALPDHPAPAPSSDFCGGGAPANPLFVPGPSGMFGRLAPDGERLVLRAEASRTDPWLLGFIAEHRGQRFVNPTLVLQPGERVRVDFENAIEEPTVVHWHGLAVDTHNDGAGLTLAAPGEHYRYDFEIRNRGALYWYHPHPHGMTAGQVYRGLFGLMEVVDDDERRLRSALDLVPGTTEIPLVLQDRRGRDYAPSDTERVHGFLGDTVLLNGTACPYLDVATRIYRFRVLNASNARTYHLGLRTAAGEVVPFTLIGTDGGLLATPVRCRDVFIATAERIDILVDLSDKTVGDTLLLETRAFDPMHLEMPASMPATDHSATNHAAMGHATPNPDASAAQPAPSEHAGHEHGGAFPEGAARGLLQLRVRKRTAYTASIPEKLASIAPLSVADATQRPIRLGFAKGRWRINDRVFAMGETPIEVHRETKETWLIRNYFNSMPHPMHLHGFHFQVLERQTSPDQVAALKIDERGRIATDLGWKDTVLVWPGESVRIAIDFTMPFPDAQTYVFHCHNLEHEDGGMMLGVKVE